MENKDQIIHSYKEKINEFPIGSDKIIIDLADIFSEIPFMSVYVNYSSADNSIDFDFKLEYNAEINITCFIDEYKESEDKYGFISIFQNNKLIGSNQILLVNINNEIFNILNEIK